MPGLNLVPDCPNYSIEAIRLRSFNNCEYFSKEMKKYLAKFGFYWPGEKRDLVKCIFCGIQLAEWQPEDTAFGEHLKHAPCCPFLLGFEVGNCPLDDIQPIKMLFPSLRYTITNILQIKPEAIVLQGQDECGLKRTADSDCEYTRPCKVMRI
jgi:hypothetical protein